MQVDYSGWKEGFGHFKCQIFLDENKTDYEIFYKNGMIAKQTSAFSYHTADWNHDGDVYEQFGAWFSVKDKDGSFCGGEFWTPEQMVRVVIDAKSTPLSKLNGNDVVDIPSIEIPPLKTRPSLDSQLRMSEKQREARDIEKNNKMRMLGIRPPNEPWAR